MIQGQGLVYSFLCHKIDVDDFFLSYFDRLVCADLNKIQYWAWEISNPHLLHTYLPVFCKNNKSNSCTRYQSKTELLKKLKIGLSNLAQGKFQTLPTDLASLASRPSVGARRVSLTKEASDSEVEEKTLISKMINFSVHNGKGRVLGRDKRRRVVEKDGDANIQYKNISKRRRKYISDLYTTLVDSR